MALQGKEFAALTVGVLVCLPFVFGLTSAGTNDGAVPEDPTGDLEGIAVGTVPMPPPDTPPPELVDPIEIVIDDTTKLTTVPDFDRVGCEGSIYRIDVPDGRDARIVQDPEMGPVRYPVWVNGGRNVHVLGLELRTLVQPGCDIGEAHQVRDPRPNVHPRLVGGKAVWLRQSGTSYVEGVDIDLAGQEADCFVSRNRRDMSKERIKADRHIVIVNTRCTGIEGLDDSKVGDGIHGDFFQNQGKDDIGSLVLENVTYMTSSNGITLHAWHGQVNRPALFRLKNVNYGWDLRYSDDDDYENTGLVFTASADVVEFENVWLNHPRGGNYGIINRQRVGAFGRSSYVLRHPDMHEGVPAYGDFATAERTGLEYEVAEEPTPEL